MYISYADFNVLFKKIELAESDFTVLEEYAESIVQNYTGVILANVGKDVGQATGMIIQQLVAMGYQPKDLPASYSEGGISTSYKEIELIPLEARKILDGYRRIDF